MADLEICDVVNWKVFLFIIMIYLIINSDIFLENILSKLDKTVEGNVPTTYGTIIQSLILGVSYLLIEPLACYGYI